MRLTTLWVADFRCYEAAEVVPAPGLTAIVGDNAQGKTSLLEAVAWLATARSFRGVPDAALVREGAARAVVRGEVVRADHSRTVEAEIAREGRNRLQVNGKGVSRARLRHESFQVTIFSPDDLDVVKGGPSGRRAYLDDLLGALTPRLAAVLADFERTLRQRNALLRTGVRDASSREALAAWDEQLVTTGAEVVRARLQLLDTLRHPLTKAYADVAGPRAASEVAGTYVASWFDGPVASGDGYQVAGALASAVARMREREIERGLTLVGPHRDDWALTVGGLDSRTHASQGEQRSLALALRLAGHAALTDALGEPPVLLLDDVFSELDAGRVEALVRHLPEGQALVTTTGALPADLPVALRLRVRAGEVVPEAGVPARGVPATRG